MNEKIQSGYLGWEISNIILLLIEAKRDEDWELVEVQISRLYDIRVEIDTLLGWQNKEREGVQ